MRVVVVVAQNCIMIAILQSYSGLSITSMISKGRALVVRKGRPSFH